MAGVAAYLQPAALDKLDELQDWLLDERTAADPNMVFALLDGSAPWGTGSSPR